MDKKGLARERLAKEDLAKPEAALLSAFKRNTDAGALGSSPRGTSRAATIPREHNQVFALEAEGSYDMVVVADLDGGGIAVLCCAGR